MARQARFFLADATHLVRQSGHNGGTIALDGLDVQRWSEIVRDVAATHKVAVHGWGLAAGEYRLLVRPPVDHALSRMVQDLGRRYVAAFNGRHGRQGTLWAGRFQCAVVESGAMELLALAYVEEVSAEWKASSAPHHLGERQDAWVVDPPAYWALGNTPFERHGAWRERLEAGLTGAQRARLVTSLKSGRPLASASTLERLQPLTPVPLQPRPRGRPRRSVPAAGRTAGHLPPR